MRCFSFWLPPKRGAGNAKIRRGGIRSSRRGVRMDVSELKTRIEALVADPTAVRTKKGKAVDEVIAALDEGLLRVAEFDGATWVTHAWIKHAILLYFARMDTV